MSRSKRAWALQGRACAIPPELDFARLKQRIRIDRVLADHDCLGNLRRRGNTLVGPCPVHGGDNPTAFRGDLERGRWMCFAACGGGDLVELVCKLRNCGHRQAAEYLATLLGETPPPRSIASISSPSPSVTTGAYRPFRRRLELDPSVPFLTDRKRIRLETARDFEAGSPRQPSVLDGMVAVRLHDVLGQPLGYCGRRLEAHAVARLGKWWFPRGFPKSEILFNAHRAAAFRARGIVVVECPWAVMRLRQAGVPGAVALLGTAPSAPQLDWLRSASWVLAIRDGDARGRAAGAALEEALAHHTRTQAVTLPKDREPEDLTDRELGLLVRTARSFFLNPSCFPASTSGAAP